MRNAVLPVLTLAAFVHFSPVASAEPTAKSVAVVLNDGAIELERALVDGNHLWVSAADVKRINGFEPKPEGFCSADICIPIPDNDEWVQLSDGDVYYCVTRFAEKVDQPVVADATRSVWAFGAVPQAEALLFTQAIAPDFELRDREGHLVRLSDFRGKKVLLLTWASW